MVYAFSDIYLLENFLLLAKKHKSTTFFETGTWHGETARDVARHINQVVTVEVNRPFYDIASKILTDIDNVTLKLGSSPVVMEDTLVENQEGLIFFLDAHWEQDWPLLDELRVIAEKNIKPVIMIHDFYVPDEDGNARFHFDSYNTQPLNMEYVKGALDSIYGVEGYTYFYSDKVENDSGVLYVEPKQ
jgi:hypothetical protein